MDHPALLDQFRAHLDKKGLRMTHQREIILETAFETDRHYTAEDLLSMVQQRDPDVSRATVYRTLSLLVECRLLRKLDLSRDQTYYDPNSIDHPDHGHLICLDCGRILEFHSETMEAMQNREAYALGFLPSSRHLRLEARCLQIQRLGTCQYFEAAGKKAVL